MCVLPKGRRSRVSWCGMEAHESYQVVAVKHALVVGVRLARRHGMGLPTSLEITNLGPHHCVIASHRLTSPLRGDQTLTLAAAGAVIAPGATTELLGAGLFVDALEASDGGGGWRGALSGAPGTARLRTIVAMPSGLLSVVTTVSGLGELGVSYDQLPGTRRLSVVEADWAHHATTFFVEGAEIQIAA